MSTTLPHPIASSAPRSGGQLRYAVVPCVVGLVLVARSDAGVAAVLLGDDADALRRDLEARWPDAACVEDAASLAPLAERVARHIAAPAGGLDVPLDLRGTPFQRMVWRALRDIPPGATATYAEVAQRLGRPGAVRAVAQACASNPVAVLVPCHRVVRSDGALSGYRWGTDRKRALLAREGAARA